MIALGEDDAHVIEMYVGAPLVAFRFAFLMV